ncbi:MAG: hypothetical protein C0594_15240 [Marinilabiliales bacterium]|nr:MAG: hypothetical protein C0594_15240 [Marinilabiliales bacterium]
MDQKRTNTYIVALLLAFWLMVFSLLAGAQESYDAKKILDLEVQNGFSCGKEEYLLLEELLNAMESMAKELEGKNVKSSVIMDSLFMLIYRDFQFEIHPEALLSNGLKEHRLDCNYLSLLYFSVLKGRLNWDLSIIRSPGHMFIRYNYSDGSYFNYETTEGKIEDDKYYHQKPMSKQSLQHGIYMSPVSDSVCLATSYLEMANAVSDTNSGKVRNLCSDAIALDPMCLPAYLRLGNMYYNNGKLKLAVECYNQILECDSLNYYAYNNLGIVYSVLGDRQLAMKNYGRALMAYSGDPSIYLNRSLEQMVLGNFEEAYTDFYKAYELLEKSENLTEMYILMKLTEDAMISQRFCSECRVLKNVSL